MSCGLASGLEPAATWTTLFRGEFDNVMEALDDALRQGWGSLTFQRTEPREINVASRRVKPLRVDVKSWCGGWSPERQLEVAADEGGAGDAPEAVPLPDLSHFGIVAAESAAALAMDFQVAQKMHACTDPHSEERRNDRVHDVVDLLLVREAFFSDEDLLQLRQACEAIFDARARDAHPIDQPVRDWLPQLEAHSHWASTYPALAGEVGLTLTFDEAVAGINDWISKIAAS